MAIYLQFDGTENYLQIPMISYSSIEFDISISSLNNDQSVVRYLFDARDGDTNFFVYNGTYSNGKPTQVKLTHVELGLWYMTWYDIPKDQRITLVASHSSNGTGTDDVVIGSHRDKTNGFSILDIYSITFKDASGNIVAHYDMNTGTVEDQSGNGYHATLGGGKWINDTDTGAVLPTPQPTIMSVSKYKISDEVDMDRSVVSFKFDIDVEEWVVRVLGVSWDTGAIADSGASVLAGEEIFAEIDWTELSQEGENRVNIYGKNSQGEWTPYFEGEHIVLDGGRFTEDTFANIYDGGMFTDNSVHREIDGGGF